MSTEKSKATVLRFVDKVQNQHDVDALDELFSPDFVGHSGISTLPNLDGTKQFFYHVVHGLTGHTSHHPRPNRRR